MRMCTHTSIKITVSQKKKSIKITRIIYIYIWNKITYYVKK